MGPTGWFFSCLLCWIVAFPAYLVKRREYLKLSVEAVQPPPVVAPSDLMSQLSALADLYQQGLLTEDEFQAKKKQLVHRMLEEDEPVTQRIRPEPPPSYAPDQKSTV